MRHRWAAVLAVCFLCASLFGCAGEAEVVKLDLPVAQSVANELEAAALADTVQAVAEAMLPSEQDAPADEEALPPDAPPSEEGMALPMVALTFDDGPLPGSTDRVLDLLEANGARATFFVQGKQVALYPDLVRRAHGLGCEIGNHTYNHKDLTALNDQDALGQIESVNSLVAELTGTGCRLVRPPHGKGWRDKRVLELVPYPLIMWSIDTKDWSTLNVQKTIAAVLDGVKDGDIVLLHDVYPETAEAAASIIPELISRGYLLVTVSEMFQYKGLDLLPGNAYRHAG